MMTCKVCGYFEAVGDEGYCAVPVPIWWDGPRDVPMHPETRADECESACFTEEEVEE